MKRVAFLALLALVLPLAAFAGTVDFTNQGGTLTGSSAGLSLSGSTLVAVEGFPGLSPISGDLGTVSFSTGTLFSSSGSGAIFNGGGTFQITGLGTNGLPSGVIFNGTFSSQVTVSFQGAMAGGDIYSISGSISGTWYNGQTVTGKTFQDYVFVGTNGLMSSSNFGSGDTFLGTVPEPGTLGLLGTGLVGMAGIIRKRLKT
jgi:PEP-CTERM motif